MIRIRNIRTIARISTALLLVATPFHLAQAQQAVDFSKSPDQDHQARRQFLHARRPGRHDQRTHRGRWRSARRFAVCAADRQADDRDPRPFRSPGALPHQHARAWGSHRRQREFCEARRIDFQSRSVACTLAPTRGRTGRHAWQAGTRAGPARRHLRWASHASSEWAGSRVGADPCRSYRRRHAR